LEIFDNLYDGNLIITKRLTEPFIDKLIEHKDKIILHCTVTGMGGSKIEPFVPPKESMFSKTKALIEKGFPVSHIVLRVDPIVPTEKGVQTAIGVINLFRPLGITRLRISFLDMYNHVKDRFKENDIPIPYDTFHASSISREEALRTILKEASGDFSIEMCGEPPTSVNVITSVPCLSQKDVDILGLTDKITLEGFKDARTYCGCPGNKTELIKDKPKQCGHKCLYCFWKTDE
jgi:hypothetical protein